MPRRRRTPKARIGGPDELTRDQRAHFFNPFGRFFMTEGCVVLYGGRVVFANPAAMRAAWEIHADDLIAEYQTTHPGKQPWPVEEWGA